MNISALREQATRTPRQDGFTGHWQVIYWQPDLFIPQRFAVGIRVASSDGNSAFRLMDKPGRIECFFNPTPIKSKFSALMALVRPCFATGDTPILPTPHVILGEMNFVRGPDADSIADRLFFENIQAARPRTDREASDTLGPDTEQTRISLSGFLKQITGLDYSRIVREQGQVLSEHYLDVTLAPDNGAGSVISVCYKSPNTIEMKMLRAAQDINAYATSLGRKKKALFLLEPSEDIALPSKERLAIDQLIGNECWKLEQAGFDTPRNTRIPAMARDIQEWATPLLAA